MLRRLTELGVRVHDGEHAAEHLGGDGVHLVQHHQPPLLRLQPLHGLLRLPRATLAVRDHGVRRDQDAGAHGLVLRLGREPRALTPL